MGLIVRPIRFPFQQRAVDTESSGEAQGLAGAAARPPPRPCLRRGCLYYFHCVAAERPDLS